MDKSDPAQSQTPAAPTTSPAPSAAPAAPNQALRGASYDEGAKRLAPPASWAAPAQKKDEGSAAPASPARERRVHGSRHQAGPAQQDAGAQAGGAGEAPLAQAEAPGAPGPQAPGQAPGAPGPQAPGQAPGAPGAQAPGQAPGAPGAQAPGQAPGAPGPQAQGAPAPGSAPTPEDPTPAMPGQVGPAGPVNVQAPGGQDSAPGPEGQAATPPGPGGDGPAPAAPGGGGPPPPGPVTDNAAPGGPPPGPGPATDNAAPGQARFVPPALGPAAIATPDSLGRHQVERVIGPDPGNGNLFFWGTPAPPEVGPDGQPIHDSFRIPQGSIDAFGEQRAAASNAALDEFLADGTARLDRLRQEKASTIEQVQTFLAAEKARAAAGIGAARQQSQGQFAGARQTVIQNAATAKGAVQGSLAQIHGQIDAKLASALGLIGNKDTAAKGQVTGLRGEFVNAVNVAFTEGVARVQDVGATFAGRALEQARGRADAYRAQPLPETSAVGNFFNGRDFESNKRAARVDAATQVGAAYAEEFRKKAGEVAGGLRNGARQVIDGASQTFTNANGSLTTAATDARAALQAAAGEAKKAASDFVAAKVRAIDTQTQQFQQALTQAEQQANAQYTRMSTETARTIDSTGQTVISMLESGYEGAASGMSRVIEEVRGVADGAEPPDPDKLKELLAQKKAELDAAESTVRSTLTQQTEAGKGQLKAACDGAITAATQLQGQVATGIQQVTGQSNDALATTRGEIERARTTVAGGFNTTADGIVRRHGETADQAIGGLRSDTTNALTNVRTRLGQYATDLTADFTQTLGGMGAKINTEAAAAAAKVQPAWKRYLSVIIKIIVAIVVAVAIAALFASGVGIGLLLLGGFLIGAAGAIVTYLADCALGLKTFEWKALGVEALKGGIGGMIGVLTAGLGGAAMTQVASYFTNAIAGTVVGFLAAVTVNFVINSVVSITQQVVDNLFNKPFSEAFSGLGTAFIENAGLNLIGAFAGSLNAGSRPQGGANPLAGTTGFREGMGNFAQNFKTGFTAGTFDASSGVGLQSVGGATMAGVTNVGGGALMGAADPADLNNVPRSQETRTENSSKLRGEVAKSVGTELNTTESTARRNGRNTPPPTAPFQFDPTQR